MAKSIDLAPEASRLSRLASLLLSYIPAVRAFVAPRHPGARATIFERLGHSRALIEGRNQPRSGIATAVGLVDQERRMRELTNHFGRIAPGGQRKFDLQTTDTAPTQSEIGERSD